MLRCQPSRIHLTSADVNSLDERIATRQRTRMELRQVTARLSCAPRLQTTVAAVNSGEQDREHRNVSVGSEATICIEDETVQEAVVWDKRTRHIPTWMMLPSPSAINTAGNAAQSLAGETMHPAKARTRRSSHSHDTAQQSQGQYTEGNRYTTGHRRRKTSPPDHSIPAFDGAADHPFHNRSRPLAGNTTTTPQHAGRAVFQELPGGSGICSPPSAEYRLLASARARRPTARSREEDFVLHEDTSAVQEAIGIRRPYLIPDNFDSTRDLLLNPAAAVFIPRTRFGSTVTISDAEGTVTTRQSDSSRDLQDARASLDIRIRSSSEQNVEPGYRQRPRSNAVTAFDSSRTNQTTSPPSRLTPPTNSADNSQQRRLSENNNLPVASPNLERYPLLLPSTNSAGRPRSDSGRSNVSQQSRSTEQRSRASVSNHESNVLPAGQTSTNRDSDHLRPISPAVSSSSRSTPNFLQALTGPPTVHSRSSSLSWAHNTAEALNDRHEPSMVSAASGISDLGSSAFDGSSASRRPSSRALDAATEFLRFRSSPLDDLTAELSRLSTSLSSRRHDDYVEQASVGSGRSVRLLNGDPFGQLNSPCREPRGTTPRARHRDSETEAIASAPTATAAVVHASAICPRSSPARPISSQSSANTTTPLPNLPGPPSPQRPLTDRSPARATRVTFDTASTTATQPSIRTPARLTRVYNDSTPARFQPQTIADLPRGHRHSRNRSDSEAQHHGIVVGRALVPSPPTIPERRSHRNTYPAAIPVVGTSLASTTSASALSAHGGVGSVQTTARGNGRRRAVENQRSAEDEVENDVEGTLAGLEEDRRLWFGRRQQGSLDVTPPREGRFERYLS